MHIQNKNNNANNRGGERKLWKLKDNFMALMVVMVSWVCTYPKVIELYTLNMFSFYMSGIPQISVKWHKKKKRKRNLQ